MTLRMVVGPPCSGKSTFVQTHALDGQPRFDFDAVASLIAGNTEESSYPPAVLDIVLSMRRGLMGYLLDPETATDGDVWVVNASPSESTVSRWVAAGGVFHVLDPGKDECLARALREGKTQAVQDAITAWYASPPEIPDKYIMKGGEPVKIKSASVQVKSMEEGTEDGTFEAYASVFGNRDSYGDIVQKGAFADTLSEWSDSGNVLPVLYGHDFADPFSNIGAVVDAVEDDHGLKITGKLDLDNPKAAQVHKLLREKRLSQMSFAFDVQKGAWNEDEDGEYYSIEKVKLYEVSVVPIGANQETEILAVKSAERANDGTSAKDGTCSTDGTRANDGTLTPNQKQLSIILMEMDLLEKDINHGS